MSKFANRILLATDGSPEAREATKMAIMLSTSLGSELHVVHVGHIPSAYAYAEADVINPDFQEMLREQAGEEARAKLGELVGEIEEAGGKISESYAEAGRPDVEIVRLAEDIGAGLVVIGSRGLGPLRRALMGSVSNSVVRHLRDSVLVVRRDVQGENYLPGKILLALDGSRESEAATRAAVEISRATGSELYILHALPTEERLPYDHPLMGERWEAALENAKRKAREFVDQKAESIASEGVQVRDAHVAFGEPDLEIVTFGEELGAALIITGSRGLGGIRRALIGSVSDSVVRHARGPVLIVRERRERETEDE